MKRAAPPALGNVNACSVAQLYRRTKHVGSCANTPNAIAYAMAETGATLAESPISGATRPTDPGMPERIKARGYGMTDATAYLVRV